MARWIGGQVDRWPGSQLVRWQVGLTPDAPLVALPDLVLGSLEEVNEGRVGLEEVRSIAQDYRTHLGLGAR